MSQEERADKIIQNFNERLSKMTNALKGQGKSVNIGFMDADYGYNIKFSMEGKVEKIDKVGEALLKKKGAVATLNATTDTWENVMDGSLTAMAALTSGRVKLEGSLDAVMKLAAAFP